jgi:autotransporter passenger strand-loop-strand repeat protein
VSSGGNQFVYGTASGTVVSSGGYGLVLSGGQVNGATLSGGLLEFQSGGTAGTSTITIASGTLRLDNSQNFGGGAQISGLTTAAQELDLADISFATASLLGYTGDTLSGILTVGDGTHTATLSLLGNYTFASFKLANDGGGGTLVVDPPFAAGEPPFLAQPTHT